VHALGEHERLLLLAQVVDGLRQNGVEVLLCQRLELNTDGKAALKQKRRKHVTIQGI